MRLTMCAVRVAQREQGGHDPREADGRGAAAHLGAQPEPPAEHDGPAAAALLRAAAAGLPLPLV